MNKILLWLGVGFFALRYASQFGAAKNLKAVFAGCKFVKGSGFMPSLQLLFDVQNGSSTPVQLQSIVGGVVLNGNTVGNVSSFDRVSIRGNGVTRVTANVSLNIAGVASYVSNAIRTKLAITAGFVGSMNVGGVVIGVNNTAKIL